MNVKERQSQIIGILERASLPVTASELAARFCVSRQVIVQDIAVLRAQTTNIISTCRGYIMQQREALTREIKVCHADAEAAGELGIIVDCGGRVKNVSIKHRIYGRITVPMDIASRQDIEEFLALLQDGKSTLLSNATAGYHYHLIEAASAERLELIERRLEQAGFLAPLRAWEIDGTEQAERGKTETDKTETDKAEAEKA